jgi:hypothetical protein
LRTSEKLKFGGQKMAGKQTNLQNMESLLLGDIFSSLKCHNISKNHKDIRDQILVIEGSQ